MSSGLTTGQKKKRKNAQHIAPFPPSYLRCKLNCLSKRQNKSDIGWQQRQKNRHSHDTANTFLFPLLSNSYFKVHMFHLAPEKKKKKKPVADVAVTHFFTLPPTRVCASLLETFSLSCPPPPNPVTTGNLTLHAQPQSQCDNTCPTERRGPSMGCGKETGLAARGTDVRQAVKRLQD